VGPNGAGKTTTIKILTGLVGAGAGRGWLFGEPIGSVSARRRLGYLPEGPYFYEYLTVEELLDFYGVLLGVPTERRKRRIDELIERVGLEHARGRQLRKFSKGMLQRAGLAQALIHDPALVILDEPKTGLDPIGRAEVTELMLDLKKRGTSVFFASHILGDVERVCDRVAVMMNGRVVKVGHLHELLDAEVMHAEVVLDGLDAEFCDLACQRPGLGWRGLGGDRVVFTVDTPESAAKLLEQAIAAGGVLRRYDERRENLEDLFLRQAEVSRQDVERESSEEVQP
jgi:ABC-2 type transport system ATP-binding protein